MTYWLLYDFGEYPNQKGYWQQLLLIPCSHFKFYFGNMPVSLQNSAEIRISEPQKRFSVSHSMIARYYLL